MKGFRKTIFFILAILPLLPVIAYILGNIGNSTGVAYVDMGTVSIANLSTGTFFAFTPDSWADRILEPLISSRAAQGILKATARFALFLEANAGIPISFPWIFAIWYFIYMFALEMLDAILSLLLFVPRKCSEVFR